MKHLILLLLLLPSSLFAQSHGGDLERLNSEIASVERQLNELTGRKAELQAQRALLVAKHESENDEFKEIRFPIVRISGEQNVILLMDGTERAVSLSGILIKMGYSAAAMSLLSDQLKSGKVYARCVDAPCDQVRLYPSKESRSLNCQLLDSGIAFQLGIPLDCSNDNLSVVLPQYAPETETTVSSGSTSSGSDSSRQPGTDVKVKGYYRKNGTYVKPHTRSAPRRRN